MDSLDQLEQQSVYILREAFRHFERLCMLWSIGKDSTVLLWLARKAFFGHVPFPPKVDAQQSVKPSGGGKGMAHCRTFDKRSPPSSSAEKSIAESR